VQAAAPAATGTAENGVALAGRIRKLAGMPSVPNEPRAAVATTTAAKTSAKKSPAKSTTKKASRKKTS